MSNGNSKVADELRQAMARRFRPLTMSLAPAFVATMLTRDALAIGPVDVEAAGTVGVGTDPLIKGGPNPLGLGGGGRAGVVFRNLYVGVALTYYPGQSKSDGTFSYPSQPSGIANPPSSDHVLMYGIEAGYGVGILGFLTFRPQIGLGNLTLSYAQPTHSEICGLPCDTTLSGSINSLYLEPGVTALGFFGVLLLGIDANVLVLPRITEPFTTSATTDTAFTMHIQLGLRF